ncbi:YqaJ viral recombinase family protein [Roseomonas xinghualingensis]|uniref:YqaJ viral recombinase family protein n=1 Tax=Roseomonas xinghualingensis TaxID=2986475 RepID=UPI0021F16E32|nr:YqaJ viral recombinase family protein [Roseomonas sp. SXEYE001]MCV4208580.1 YqaJ viral recombinase family protein [Roseomonas sp. SXEYE001]
MGIRYYPDLVQGTEEWLQARCGILTASEMKLILTPTLKVAANKDVRTHLYELLAQRITQHVEPHYVGDDMLRGQEDEVEARILYAERYAPVREVGFITNDKWGFTIGYSPDGLVGDDGLIECKSRRQKYQVQTILQHVEERTVPPEYLLQVQTGLLVSERSWLDFISYSGGLPMVTIRCHAVPEVQEAIIGAATEFERQIAELRRKYSLIVGYAPNRLIPTERRIEQEMVV